MKPIISKKEYQEIYDLLNSTEVTDGDCGKLCGAACCTVSGDYSEDDMVIYLLPGEEGINPTLKADDTYDIDGELFTFAKCVGTSTCAWKPFSS